MESTSIDIEHSIFKNSKTDIGYKTAMLKKVIKLFPSKHALVTRCFSFNKVTVVGV